MLMVPKVSLDTAKEKNSELVQKYEAVFMKVKLGGREDTAKFKFMLVEELDKEYAVVFANAQK